MAKRILLVKIFINFFSSFDSVLAWTFPTINVCANSMHSKLKLEMAGLNHSVIETLYDFGSKISVRKYLVPFFNITLTHPIGLPPQTLVAQKIADQR